MSARRAEAGGRFPPTTLSWNGEGKGEGGLSSWGQMVEGWVIKGRFHRKAQGGQVRQVGGNVRCLQERNRNGVLPSRSHSSAVVVW